MAGAVRRRLKEGKPACIAKKSNRVVRKKRVKNEGRRGISLPRQPPLKNIEVVGKNLAGGMLRQLTVGGKKRGRRNIKQQDEPDPEAEKEVERGKVLSYSLQVPPEVIIKCKRPVLGGRLAATWNNPMATEKIKEERKTHQGTSPLIQLRLKGTVINQGGYPDVSALATWGSEQKKERKGR